MSLDLHCVSMVAVSAKEISDIQSINFVHRKFFQHIYVGLACDSYCQNFLHVRMMVCTLKSANIYILLISYGSRIHIAKLT